MPLSYNSPELACIAVVFVSFKPSGASMKDTQEHWARKSKKVRVGGGGGRAGEGKQIHEEPRRGVKTN